MARKTEKGGKFINYRQKKMGYNAAKELYNRVQRNLAKRDEEDD